MFLSWDSATNRKYIHIRLGAWNWHDTFRTSTPSKENSPESFKDYYNLKLLTYFDVSLTISTKQLGDLATVI